MSDLTDAPVVQIGFDSFDGFFEAKRHRLFRALYLVTGSAEEAEELTQDAFIAVWERWDRVRLMERPEGYLYRVAMNRWRNRRRRLVHAAKHSLVERSTRDPFEDADLHDEIVRAIRELAPRQRAALVLTELLEHTSEEAAALMGASPSTVRNLAAQGRAALRQALEARDG